MEIHTVGDIGERKEKRLKSWGSDKEQGYSQWNGDSNENLPWYPVSSEI